MGCFSKVFIFLSCKLCSSDDVKCSDSFYRFCKSLCSELESLAYYMLHFRKMRSHLHSLLTEENFISAYKFSCRAYCGKYLLTFIVCYIR